MKTQLSSLDIYFLTGELSRLAGARIDKVYQIGARDFKVSLRGDGKEELILTPAYMCLTRFKHKAPRKPSNFAMLLRKHLAGGVIKEVRQHRFDRVVELEIEGRGRLIIELFSRGNVILLDEEGVITGILESQEWKDRTLKPGLHYAYPPEVPDITSMSASQFAAELSKGQEAVKALASGMGLGAVYANEVLERAGVGPNAKADKEGAEELYSAIQDMLGSEVDPRIIRENGEAVDAVPFEMISYCDYVQEKRESFNRAVDEYFTTLRAEDRKEEATKDYRQERKRLEKVIEKQKESIRELEEKVEELKQAGDKTYADFRRVDSVLKGIKGAKSEGTNWVKYCEGRGIRIADPAERKIEVDGIGVYIDKSIAQNASIYYEKSKKAKSKLEGAKKALRKSERELRLVEEGEVKVEKKTPDKPIEKPKPEWYEKFRWFMSGDGFLVIGGRDATTNDILIKKHLEPDDLVFHSTVHGAPFFIVKNPEGKNIPESTKRQAAEAAASYSSAWNAGWGSADVYAVKPEQVSKTAESGEYLTKGAFMVRGDREWFRKTPLKIAVGFKVNDYAEAIGGPEGAVDAYTKHHVTIGVGNKKSGQLSREIKENILRRTNKEDGQKIKKANLGDIQKWIPSGKGMILK